MKTAIITMALLYSGITGAQNWCPPGASWTYHLYSESGNGYQNVSYEKDTIVMSQPCKKLQVYEVVPHFNGWGQPFTGIDTISLPPIYTFSQNDTVFTLYDQQFRAIYFFNAQVGDTLTHYNFIVPENTFAICGDTVMKMLVDSTGTVVINSETLRFYRAIPVDFNSPYMQPDQVMVIEKLGAVDNYFVPYYVCHTDGDYYKLRCYSDFLFPTHQTTPVTACDYIFTGIQDLESASISIVPNPTNNLLRIVNPGNSEIASIQIYNLIGQLQKDFEKSGNQDITVVDVSDLQSGAYLMQLVSSTGHRTTVQFIRQ